MTPTQADREVEDRIYYAQHWGMGQPGEIAMHFRLAAEAAAFDKAAEVARGYAEQVDRDMLAWDYDDEALAVATGRGIAATNIETAIRKLAGEKYD